MGSENLGDELVKFEPDESHQLIFAGVEQAAGGMGRRPEARTEQLGTAQQHRDILEFRKPAANACEEWNWMGTH